jgi:TMEM175 potassium channel family protein
LWANLHLLFWLSLVPFTTAWMGENNFVRTPTIAYGVNLLAAAIAYQILVRAIIGQEGPGSRLKQALGSDVKGNVSTALYVAAIGLAFISAYIADAIYVLVALVWLVPDRRIERHVADA